MGQRDLALGARDDSETARKAAQRERERAERGMSVAEQRAALEAEARTLAEQDRAAALAGRELAERELLRASSEQVDLETELVAIRADLTLSISLLETEKELRQGEQLINMAWQNEAVAHENLLSAEVERLRAQLDVTEEALIEALLGPGVTPDLVEPEEAERQAAGAPPSF